NDDRNKHSGKLWNPTGRRPVGTLFASATTRSVMMRIQIDSHNIDFRRLLEECRRTDRRPVAAAMVYARPARPMPQIPRALADARTQHLDLGRDAGRVGLAYHATGRAATASPRARPGTWPGPKTATGCVSPRPATPVWNEPGAPTGSHQR